MTLICYFIDLEPRFKPASSLMLSRLVVVCSFPVSFSRFFPIFLHFPFLSSFLLPLPSPMPYVCSTFTSALSSSFPSSLSSYAPPHPTQPPLRDRRYIFFCLITCWIFSTSSASVTYIPTHGIPRLHYVGTYIVFIHFYSI